MGEDQVSRQGRENVMGDQPVTQFNPRQAKLLRDRPAKCRALRASGGQTGRAWEQATLEGDLDQGIVGGSHGCELIHPFDRPRSKARDQRLRLRRNSEFVLVFLRRWMSMSIESAAGTPCMARRSE